MYIMVFLFELYESFEWYTAWILHVQTLIQSFENHARVALGKSHASEMVSQKWYEYDHVFEATTHVGEMKKKSSRGGTQDIAQAN